MPAKDAETTYQVPGESRSDINDVAISALLVFACFTLVTSGYLAWLYHLVSLTTTANADVLTMGAGYLCQGIGIAAITAFSRKRPEAMGRIPLIVAIAFHFACAASAALSENLAGAIVFGCTMSFFCGVVSSFYLLRLAACVREERRGIAFGAGYACSTVATWLLSMLPGIPSANLPTELISCAVFSVITVIVVMAVPAPWPMPSLSATPESDASAQDTLATNKPSPKDAGEQNGRRPQEGLSIIALACITVLLMSMVKNIGFSFPSADLGDTVNLELSRLFYGMGLLIAGFVIDRNRKYGALACMAALVVPFAIMALSNEPMPSAILWVVDYLFYGFFSVFRVVLFCDLAAQSEKPHVSGFGLMFGRFGDAMGTVLCVSLAGSTYALVIMAAVLFAATVFTFHRLFQALYTPKPEPVRDERAIFDAFAAQYELSPRERDILRLVLDNQTNAEAAATLFVSESTVKYHVRNVLKKTGCKNRIELLAKYAEQ